MKIEKPFEEISDIEIEEFSIRGNYIEDIKISGNIDGLTVNFEIMGDCEAVICKEYDYGGVYLFCDKIITKNFEITDYYSDEMEITFSDDELKFLAKEIENAVRKYFYEIGDELAKDIEDKWREND